MDVIIPLLFFYEIVPVFGCEDGLVLIFYLLVGIERNIGDDGFNTVSNSYRQLVIG